MSRLSFVIYILLFFICLFIYKYLFLVTVCKMSLFRTLQVMNVDVDETVIRNQIHIKGINTPETKQEGRKKAYHETITTYWKQGILYKTNLYFAKFLKEPPLNSYKKGIKGEAQKGQDQPPLTFCLPGVVNR